MSEFNSTKYTDQQIKWVIAARTQRGFEWSRVASEFSKKFGGARTAAQMRHLFLQHTTPDNRAKGEPEQEKHPLEDFTHSTFDRVVRRAESTDRKRYFVTAASPVSSLSERLHFGKREFGANLFVPGLKAAQTWLREMGGELVILPMRAHMQPLQKQPSHYDYRLRSLRDRFASEFIFNDHLRGMDVHLNPQQVLPLTGLHRIRGRAAIRIGEQSVQLKSSQSIIFAHAQQDMETLATGNGTYPRQIWTTGAITKPEYLRNRIGRLAHEAHILGGLIVEVEDEKFWIRPVQFAEDGSFVDLGVKYTASGRVERGIRAEAFRIGDLHAGRGSMTADLPRLFKMCNPKRVFVEDIFDGGSINPHERGKFLSRAMRPPQFRSLEAELVACAGVFLEVEEAAPDDAEIVIPECNHHNFEVSFLESGDYVKDPVNHEIGHRMVVNKYDGLDPLKVRLDPGNQYTWLEAEDDYFIDGVQWGAHGHRGADGAKGSKAQLEKLHGDGVVGHVHSPFIRGRLYAAGHSSNPRHGYNRGPSSWLIARAVQWEGGQKQLLTSINGRSWMDDVGEPE